MRLRGRMLAAAAFAMTALTLAACTGLPTSGDVTVGLELGESPAGLDFLPVASGPAPGADPESIVEGFMEAAITPADDWRIAREFLTPGLRETWQPAEGVSIDASAIDRTVTASLPEGEIADADTIDVQVLLDQVASVDATGAYSEQFGASNVAFSLARGSDGEWRISKAPDGVVIDRTRFAKVFDHYALQYFDRSWSRLVPDVRWFPRRSSIATTVTQALIGDDPSPWLAPAVQSAFPAEVQLARDAVPIDQNQVAEVALTRQAATLDPTTLARMRTQLQQTLLAAGVHVSQVQFVIAGRTLNAGVVSIEERGADAGPLVLTDSAFGTISGDEIVPVPGISDEILGIADRVVSVDLAADQSQAAVLLGDGHVYRVREGSVDQVDSRPGILTPSLDPYGYIWTVPQDQPAAVTVAGSDAVPRSISGAWSGASSISQMRVSDDGARLAAVITVGGQRWVAIAAVERDADGLPTGLGDFRQLTRLAAASSGLVWLGAERLGVLTDELTPSLLTQMVGGPGGSETAPAETVSVAGSRTVAGVRVLDAGGALFAHSGSAWQEIATDIRVLGTRAGQ